MADKNHSFAVQMLHYHGFQTRSDITSRFVGHSTKTDVGRADIAAARQSIAVNIEVKQGGVSFRHHPAIKNGKWDGGWMWNQRLWGAMSQDHPFNTRYWIFLTLGKNPPHWNPEKYEPKRSWLIPYYDFLEPVMLSESLGMKSFPYRLKKGVRTIYVERNLGAVERFRDYELEWAKQDSLVKPQWFFENSGDSYGGFWIVPSNHKFYKDHIMKPQIFQPLSAQSTIEKIIASIPDIPKEKRTNKSKPRKYVRWKNWNQK